MNEELWIRQIQALDAHLQLTQEQQEQLQTFYHNLVEWNQVMNLTTITEEKDVYEKHFLDSLSIVRALPWNELQQHKTLIDVGTGAGFPGLVLAIAFPSLHVTLMDSLNKRINFLNDTLAKCKVNNVTCIHSRAEELAHQKTHREHYDLAVSRAVANLSTLSEYCLPFVRTGGRFIAYKGEKLSEEMSAGEKAIHILGGSIEQNIQFTLPETDYERNLLVVAKEKHTPAKYPRKSGTPSREPLGSV